MNRKLVSTAMTLALAAGTFAPAVALAADPSPAAPAVAPNLVQVADAGDHVSITIKGSMADVDNIRWRWGKMHVPIDTGPGRIFAKSFDDATVKRIAVIGGESPRVMILFRHGDKTAKKLTDAAEIEPADGGFRIVIPRKKTLMPPPPVVPEPVAPVVAPTPAAPPSPPVDAEQAVAGVAEAAADASPEGDAAPETDATVETDTPFSFPSFPVTTPDETADDESLEGIATASTTSSSAAWMGVMTSLVILGACGAALVWARRRNAGLALAGNKFEVLGNQALGGKARLVLLGLGERRMLLAVNEASTTLVDKWSVGDPLNAVGPVSAEQVEAAPRIDREASSPLSALEFDAPSNRVRLPAEPAWLDELRGNPPANDDADFNDAESSAVTGLLELRRGGKRAANGGGQDDQRWVEALAAQLRAEEA